MADLIKNMYSREYLHNLAADLRAAYAPFAAEEFVGAVMDDTWASLELKGRMRQITVKLRDFLPADYAEAIGVINRVIVNYGTWLEGFGMMSFPDFVEVYGLDDWEVSMAALERYTPHASAEFAVRPFILRDPQRMMTQMDAWAQSDNPHVRRLASEGCRPALPWAQALPIFKKDPAPILPILERLKTDPDLYVRKSVANNLNDISKTHPEWVAKLARQWYGQNAHTDWIVKHGCRTLLKKGNRDVLALFGFGDADAVEVTDLAVDTPEVAMGQDLRFSFTISAKKTLRVRLEFVIDFVKANGKTARKIFQLSEQTMKAGETKRYVKKHAFIDLSTRKHYPGTHRVTLVVNGVERGGGAFEVGMKSK
ncbi:MAG: DNA alkylation repair protein [Defluviitaleaceae bacterium]|nr:DNA alkylation repair protein [Defluviitaleaceae bacterium]